MSERQTISPEADPQTLNDLYIQAAACLKVWQDFRQAEITPSLVNPNFLSVNVKLPELNGRGLELEYERPNLTDNPTQVDKDYPLYRDDEYGHNIWATWITIRAFDSNGRLINDIRCTHSSNNTKGVARSAMAHELALQPGQNPELLYMPVSMLEAKNLIGHILWASQQFIEYLAD